MPEDVRGPAVWGAADGVDQLPDVVVGEAAAVGLALENLQRRDLVFVVFDELLPRLHLGAGPVGSIDREFA